MEPRVFFSVSEKEVVYAHRHLSRPARKVVPMAKVRAIAEQLFMNHKFNVVEDDHFLHSTFATLEWDTLLGLQDLSPVQ